MKQGTKFFCFSPPVMVATFVIEIMLAIYVLWRYTFNPATRLVVLILCFLAAFQAAEFMVCRGVPGHALLWARMGYVAITMLPPLGLHLAFALARRRFPWFAALAAYGTAAGFIVFFGYVAGALNREACLGNYVIFEVAPGSGLLYGLYYYMWLAVGLATSWSLAQTVRKARHALWALAFGYLVFIVPTATVAMLSHNTLRGIPSIMCGFAVLLALALAFVVMPSYNPKHPKERRR